MTSDNPNKICFSTFDLVLKKGGKVQLFDKDSLVELEEDETIVTYDTQMAIVTHYLHSKAEGNKTSYDDLAKKIIDLWMGNDILTRIKGKDLSIYPLQTLFCEDGFSVPYPTPENPQFTFIDLFAGIGGFRIALQDLGGKCVFSSEWDKQAQKTYYANYGEIPFGDITTEETKSYIPTEFDVLCAGFPCQPFSYAGLGQGFEDETRGTLFFEICKILETHRPKMFFLENVKGLVSHNNGETIRIILDHLTKLGYDIHFKVLSSLDYGLPQKRERWYCVGFDKKVNFEFPEPLNNNPTLRQIVDPNDNNPSLKLSAFEMDRIKYHFAHCHETERVQHDNSKYAPTTKKGKYGIFSFQKPDGSLRFHVGDVAKTQIQEAFYACLDTYAPTIIAGRVPKMWDLGRRLSVLESKRLQGFPDDFIMPVADGQAYHQLGNSVSVPIIKMIMANMLKAYNN